MRKLILQAFLQPLLSLFAVFLFSAVLAPSPAFAQCNFTGRWKDNWRDMITMTQTGSAVSGNYVYLSGPATLGGTVAGAVLTGTFQQPSHPAAEWRNGGMTVTLSDCDHWEGTFTNNVGGTFTCGVQRALARHRPAVPALSAGLLIIRRRTTPQSTGARPMRRIAGSQAPISSAAPRAMIARSPSKPISLGAPM
jgi:hypothetical protein